MKKRKYKNSGYSGGGASVEKPSLKTYYPAHYSAKSDIEQNLDLLRRRAHDLAINSSLGAAIINCMVSGVIGSQLQLYPVPEFVELGLDGEKAREWARNVRLRFNSWANNLDADFTRRNNFYELARIAFQSYLTDGDSFCVFRRDLRRRGSTLALQLIEAARVSTPLDKGGINGVEALLSNEHRIVNGIEVDKSGRMLAVHISNRVWNEPTTENEISWQRVKMYGIHGTRNVLQISFDTRPEMYRGTPLLSPVIESLKQVMRYSDAELTGAIIKSYFSLFFVQQQSSLDLNTILPQEELDVREYRLGSGTISSLPRGVDVKAVESAQAQKTFAEFTGFLAKMIASAVGLPAEVVMRSYNSSYSASRASLLQAEAVFKERRQAFINDFLQPVYEMWLSEMVATGAIDAPGYFEDELKRYCWSRADWRREVMPAIDPVKEANALTARLNAGVTSRQIEATRLGNDYSVVKEDIKNERI